MWQGPPDETRLSFSAPLICNENNVREWRCVLIYAALAVSWPGAGLNLPVADSKMIPALCLT